MIKATAKLVRFLRLLRKISRRKERNEKSDKEVTEISCTQPAAETVEVNETSGSDALEKVFTEQKEGNDLHEDAGTNVDAIVTKEDSAVAIDDKGVENGFEVSGPNHDEMMLLSTSTDESKFVDQKMPTANVSMSNVPVPGETWLRIIGQNRSEIAPRVSSALSDAWYEEYEGSLPAAGRKTKNIAKDGNCYPRCMAAHLLGSQDRHGEIRKAVMDAIRCNRTLSEGDIGNQNRTEAIRWLKEMGVEYDDGISGWDAYLLYMSRPGVFADEIFIRASAICYNTPICVFYVLDDSPRKYRD
ncbi:hypothetical protein HK102_000184 [Quaeritorhiza haematococci]|nr:hypothetical protein HK102_000184 [Quaeritorhiza haematococci]